MNHAAVEANRWPRPDSASGVIDDSIDSPHGDQVERAAEATATTKPAATTIEDTA
jgi:hypothetical protein